MPLLHLHITILSTGSKQQSLAVTDNVLHVRLKSRPIKGDANKELIFLISKLSSVPKTNVSVSKGAKSKSKIVAINTNSYTNVDEIIGTLNEQQF
eukprot:GAHX01000095.1.p1 GENE.GAHX01000095.1~~GAHX01000095.1.p1  ORF type:complete len:95 (+),score=13.77 GAHX01000095.1:251-535(+)